MPVLSLFTAGVSTSARGTGRSAFARPAERPGALPAPAGWRVSSTNVSHSPQPGQRPCHLGASWPQVEQTKALRGGIPQS